jgi:hypothetical protein
MDKAEIRQIAGFLSDVREGLFRRSGEPALRLHLTELYRIIPQLADANRATENQTVKTLLKHLTLKAKRYEREIERRLAVRN